MVVTHRLAVWLVWWLALFWLWMLLVGEWNRIEWVAASCAATVAATLAERARALSGLRVRIPLRDVVAVWTVPAMVIVDFGILVGVLVVSLARGRIVRGSFLAREFDPGAGRAPRGFGSRAWRTYAATVSPNAYVVDSDEERGLVLMHDLVTYRKSEEPAV